MKKLYLDNRICFTVRHFRDHDPWAQRHIVNSVWERGAAGEGALVCES